VNSFQRKASYLEDYWRDPVFPILRKKTSIMLAFSMHKFRGHCRINFVSPAKLRFENRKATKQKKQAIFCLACFSVYS
jgi:hypothetical protein